MTWTRSLRLENPNTANPFPQAWMVEYRQTQVQLSWLTAGLETQEALMRET